MEQREQSINQMAGVKQEEAGKQPSPLGPDGPWVVDGLFIFRATVIQELIFGMIAPIIKKSMTRKPRSLPVTCSVTLHQQLHLIFTMGQDSLSCETELELNKLMGPLTTRTYKAGSHAIMKSPLTISRHGAQTKITFWYEVWSKGGALIWPEMDEED